MIRRPPRSTLQSSSAASDVYKRQEMEAWREMSDFFGEQFETNILEIQTKYIDEKNVIETEIDSQKQRIELLERNNLDQERKDMWDD